jgi:hypothetical protein
LAVNSTSMHSNSWLKPDPSLLRDGDSAATWSSGEGWEPDTEQLGGRSWVATTGALASPTKKPRRRVGLRRYLVHEKEDPKPYSKYRYSYGELKFQRPVVRTSTSHQLSYLLI